MLDGPNQSDDEPVFLMALQVLFEAFQSSKPIESANARDRERMTPVHGTVSPVERAVDRAGRCLGRRCSALRISEEGSEREDGLTDVSRPFPRGALRRPA